MLNESAPPQIEILTPQGRVRGVRAKDSFVFRGIPYAQPPVGPRRFRAPIPVQPWSGVREAAMFSAVCPQPYDVIDTAMGAEAQPQSEAQCLTLSVWQPLAATPADRLPVLVWIHGGALSSGASSWPQYDGHAFARDGVIFIGINYRLHAFGFIDFDRFTPSRVHQPSTNLGLQDAELALRWIQDNVSAFGGDPDNVTIFGESAGGAMVNALVALRTAQGLFHRAVMQSGTAARLIEPAAAEQIARNALTILGIPPGDRTALEAVPAARLVDLVTEPRLMDGVDTDVTMPWLFTRDPEGLDLDGVQALEEGRADGLELMVGWTRDEYRLRWLTTAPHHDHEDLSSLGPLEQQAVAAHARHRPDLDLAEVKESVLNHQHFFAPAIRLAATHAARGNTSYVYEFGWRSPVLGGRLGACHALEIPFVFDHEVAPRFHGHAPLPRTLVEAMHTAWTAFARHGNPSTPSLPWPAYHVERRRVMHFDDPPRVAEDSHRELTALWSLATDDQIGIA